MHAEPTAAHVARGHRVNWIDSVKVLAIAMVVLVHVTERVTNYGLAGFATGSLVQGSVVYGCMALGRMGVPLFLMVSGYLLLNRDYAQPGKVAGFWKKNLVGVLITAEIWIVLTTVFLFYYEGKPIDPATLTMQMLFLAPQTAGHLWYIPMIVGLYLFVPFVGIVLKRIDDRLLAIPVAIAFVWLFCFSDLSPLTPTMSNALVLDWSGGVFGVYMIMGYLVRRGHFARIPKAVLWLLLVAGVAACIAIQFAMYQNGIDKGLWYTFPAVFVASFALFCLASRSRLLDRKNAAVRSISGATFGIYLLHYPLVAVFSQLLANVGGMPVQAACTWALALGISWAVIAVVARLLPRVAKVLFYARA